MCYAEQADLVLDRSDITCIGSLVGSLTTRRQLRLNLSAGVHLYFQATRDPHSMKPAWLPTYAICNVLCSVVPQGDYTSQMRTHIP